MSNRFGYIFNKFPILLLLILSAIKLYSFEPKRTDFVNSYQYNLYQSWLSNGKLNSDFPAAFTSDKVVKNYKDIDGREINIEYDWQNWKITTQREIVPLAFYINGERKIEPYVNFIERFFYRLNCKDEIFLFDLIDHNKVLFKYKELTGDKALKLFGTDKPVSRLKLEPVELISNSDTLGFKFVSEELAEFQILFPQVFNINEILSEISKREFIKSEDLYPEIIEPRKEKVKPYVEDLSLAEYLRNFFDQPPRRELYHNKVKNINRFLTEQFPEHSISNSKNIWHLEIEKYENNLGGDISLNVEMKENIVNFFPRNYWEITGKTLKLGSDEIDLSSLSETEISNIVNFIPHLIYEHRSIGTKLLNFLLIHDEVPSTLVVYSDKRELYETDSYSDILLLLNKYWQDRTTYFGIESVKKVNGTIEFKGFLVASTRKGSSDLAEIYFHISREYRIDLIMVILHPDQEVKG